MGIRITVYSGQKVIDGRATTVSTKLPNGQPAFGSESANNGNEWEHRTGIEIDLDPSILSDPEALHRTISGYQKAVTRLMREELTRMGAPPHLITGGNGNGNGHQVAAAAPPAAIAAPAPVAAPAREAASAPTQAPAPPAAKRSPAPWGGGAAPATTPARRGKAKKEGQPPTTGGELLGWARGLGMDDDPKFWFTNYAKSQAPKMSTMIKDWTEEQVLKAYNAYLEACEGA
jgi:hypothetical protein